MRENDCIKETCVDLNHDGLGVVKVENFPVFVNAQNIFQWIIYECNFNKF